MTASTFFSKPNVSTSLSHFFYHIKQIMYSTKAWPETLSFLSHSVNTIIYITKHDRNIKGISNKLGWAGPRSSSKFSKFQLDSKYSTVKMNNDEKNWVQKYFGSKKISWLFLSLLNLLDLNWLNLSWKLILGPTKF